jgi:hypothetical protein
VCRYSDIDWRVGSSVYRGSGTLAGNLLTVDRGSSTPVIYALGPDGRLTGLWDAALVWPRNLISFQLRGLKI